MDFSALYIELAMAILPLLILFVALALPEKGKDVVAAMTMAGLVIVGGMICWQFPDNTSLFGGIYQADVFSKFFKLLTVIALFIIVLASMHYVQRNFADRSSEFYAFLCFAGLGMMLLASAGDMITMYIGLEVMTISFYIVTAYCLTDHRSVEAGLKYLILGSISSAFMLFGMSFVYGLTGTTIISEIAANLTLEPALIAGILLILAGFAFKVSLVPFHMWTPDIYHGAPTPITMFLSVGSKAAAFAAMVRIFVEAFPAIAIPESNWQCILAIIAALTIVIGNLIAIPQTNIKRMLAYSSVAQAGYIVIGLLSVNAYGLEGLLYYALLYVFSNLGALAVVSVVEMKTGSTEFAALAGLGRRSPFLAAMMSISLLSLAGIPPLAGFVGKLYLFTGAVEAGYLWLAFLGLVMSMIAAYYYLNVAKVMYADEAVYEEKVETPLASKMALVICLAGTIIMGVYPGPIANLTEQAIRLFGLL